VPDVIKCEVDGMVAVLTLNRPEKLNALSNELLDALMNTLDRIELDRAVRSIVITGAGRAFSAGADIAAFQNHMRAGAPEAIAHFMRPGHRMTRRVESFPKPIIAAVNGLAFGGGCELVEATHIAIAADSATFSKAEVNIGIIPTFGGTQRLPRNVGRKAATELILSGRVFEASEAARLGLVNRVVSADDLLGIAVRLAAELASKPPLTLAAALSAIHRGMDAAIDDGLAIEEAAFARIVPTHDAQEGVAAFVEKRRPVFLGH
jgi:enoyl-CoA hydratase